MRARFRRTALTVATSALLALAPDKAGAGSCSGSLGVSVDKISPCTVTATDLEFPDYDGRTDVAGSAVVTVRCSGGVPFNIALDAGLHFEDGSGRRMRGGAGGAWFMTYRLFQDAGHTTGWGSADYGGEPSLGASRAGTGDGAPREHTVHGEIGGGQKVPAGSYADTVEVTVYW